MALLKRIITQEQYDRGVAKGADMRWYAVQSKVNREMVYDNQGEPTKTPEQLSREYYENRGETYEPSKN